MPTGKKTRSQELRHSSGIETVPEQPVQRVIMIGSTQPATHPMQALPTRDSIPFLNPSAAFLEKRPGTPRVGKEGEEQI
jgi:hypothetical protein